jgi:RNA polymerase sigma-70 factor (ECF subfamily)
MKKRYTARRIKTAQNPHDAYDITQEVFISIARNLNSFKGESSLSTWIYRITANKCIDLRKKAAEDLSTLHRRRHQRRGKPSDHPGGRELL